MKKIYIMLLFLTILILPVLLISCGDKDEKNLTSYKMQLEFNEEENILYGEEEVIFFNNYDNAFKNLYFHLYPNAFREDAKNLVVSTTKVEDAYPNGYSYGHIDIKEVSADNSLEWQIEGEDQNILNVSLPYEVYPEEKITIKIEFEVLLAGINHRLGYGENTINFGNFYPVLAVYNEGVGFMLDPYHSNGDPFYSECANYQVSVTYSSKYQIAHSGKLISYSEANGQTTINVEENKIRDFAFVLSEKFQKSTAVLEDITINFFGYNEDEDIEERLSTCLDAVGTFNDLIGNYPYDQLNIVKSNFVHGGMEYPQLVLISDRVEGEDENYVIVHEIAHQWWYGVVGNDEYNHGWIDEGLAEYSTLLFFEQNSQYGLDYTEMINANTESYKLFERVYKNVTGSVDGRMDRPLDQFNTEPEYVQCVYNKSVIMYDSLRQMIGQRKFMRAIKDLYKNYSYQNISPQTLIASFIDSTGYNLEGFFNSWLRGEVVIQ